MKNFKDLEFQNHPNQHHFEKMAKMSFENNYGVSVISGYGAYSDHENPYEVAVLFDGHLCYTTDITDDVIGYCTEDKVTEIMKIVQELK